MNSTHDTLFLAITRMACVYGVPLAGFLLGVGGPVMLFDVTSNYSLWWRLAWCGASLIWIILTMRELTAREPKWFAIAATWSKTRLPVLLSGYTRHFGGTTMRPLPCDLRRSYAETRDYAG